MAKASPTKDESKDSKNDNPNPNAQPSAAPAAAKEPPKEPPAPEDPAYATLQGRYVVRHPKASFKGVLAGQRFSAGYTATDISASAAELAKLGCKVHDRTTNEPAFTEETADSD